MTSVARKFSDHDLAALLARGVPVAQAAAIHGIDRRTVQRRLNDRAFRRLVAKFRAEIDARLVGDAAKQLVDVGD
jgi:hypothetical protein